MNVDVRHAGEVIIVDLQGELVLGVGDEILREVMNELVAERWTKIVVNLAGVTRMDSAGIGELVASWKMAQRFGARMHLLRPSDRVRHTLHLSQVLPLLHVYEDEAEAVAAFVA